MIANFNDYRVGPSKDDDMLQFQTRNMTLECKNSFYNDDETSPNPSAKPCVIDGESKRRILKIYPDQTRSLFSIANFVDLIRIINIKVSL